MVELSVSPHIVDDVFIEICKNLDFNELLKLQLLSKHYKNIIRNTRWIHTEVKLKNTNDINNKIKYLTSDFNFKKYKLKKCDKITDESVKLLQLNKSKV